MRKALDDTDTKVYDLKQMVKEFSDERDWGRFHNAKDLAIGIVTEASELLELFRFKSERESELLFKNRDSGKMLRDELADVFYFALRLAQRYDIDVSKSLSAKIEQNARKYPVGKAKSSNKKYTEFES
jgi:NTP pyrophosphatase (non-canonical NTP hydrolase)